MSLYIHPSCAAPNYNPHLSQNTPNLGHHGPGWGCRYCHWDPPGRLSVPNRAEAFCHILGEINSLSGTTVPIPAYPGPLPVWEHSVLAQPGALGEWAP